MMARLLKILLLMILLIPVACSRKAETEVPEAQGEFPDQESWNATIRITRDGNTIGLLKAGHIQKFYKQQKTLLKDSIQVDFFKNNGSHTSILYAAGGQVYDKRQDMLAYGNVIVVSDSGVVLYTDTLHWDNKKQKIYTEIPVMIVTDEADTLFGDRFESGPELVNYEIVNPRGRSSKMIRLD